MRIAKPRGGHPRTVSLLALAAAVSLTAVGCGGGGGGGGDTGLLGAGTITAAGGTVTAIWGTALVAPAGATTTSTNIGIFRSSDVAGGTGATQFTVAGTAVSFQPEGQTFAVPVTITIPYDENVLASLGRTETLGSLVILKRNDVTQAVTQITPSSIDTVNNLVSFTTTSFSTFQSASASTQATALAFQTQPTNTVASAAITPAPTVGFLDALGGSVTNTATTVTLTLTGPTTTLGGTTSVTTSAGVATFSNLTIATAGSGYRLNAAAQGLTSVQSNTFNVTAGVLNSVTFTTQPVTGPFNKTMTTFVITGRDAVGNTTTDTFTVTLSLANNPRSGTLSGTTQKSGTGTVSFTDIKIDRAAEGYTIAASATTSATTKNVTSTAFDQTVFDTTQSRLITLTGFGNVKAMAVGSLAPVTATATDDLALLEIGGTLVMTVTNAATATAPQSTSMSASATSTRHLTPAIMGASGDNSTDILVANDSGAHQVSVFFTDGSANITSSAGFATATIPTPVAVFAADVADNTVTGSEADVILVGGDSTGKARVALFPNNGNGTFATGTEGPYTHGTATGPTAAAIVLPSGYNSDGDAELFVLCAGTSDVAIFHTLSFFNESATTDLTVVQSVTATGGTGPSAIAAANVDPGSSGQIVMAVANTGSNNVSVFKRVAALTSTTDRGLYSAPVLLTLGTSTSPVAVAMGDYDGDGRLDIAVACSGGNTVVTLLQDPFPATAGSFTRHGSFSITAGTPRALATVKRGTVDDLVVGETDLTVLRRFQD